ncbi:MAG: hypothetical protein WC604_03620 [Candidatus Gracilibacteria bacterium]
MTNKGKVLAAVIAVVVVLAGGVGLYLKGGDLMGFTRMNSSSSSGSSSGECTGKWVKVFSATGTQDDANVNSGSMDDLFKKAENGCEFKVVRSIPLSSDAKSEGLAIECDVVAFEAYPLSLGETSPSIRLFSCSGAPVTDYMGVDGSGEDIVETVGRDFLYVEYKNGHGEITYQWHDTNGANYVQSLESANYMVFVR